jgi:outer membrane receptor protein involved in Fe transport
MRGGRILLPPGAFPCIRAALAYVKQPMRSTLARLVQALAAVALGAGAGGARAGGFPGADLPEVLVTAARGPQLIGRTDSASEGTVSEAQLENRPLLRPGEVLEVVPGLIVTQHSGDGKANQYFLRGFNLDHGTDFATAVDGVPVNMPTHAHGQGYSDLNFLIPELVERVDYQKGVYYADQGDFSAAGAAEIRYRRSLDAPFATLSGGPDGYREALVAASVPLAGGDLLLAADSGRTDGPWVLAEGDRHVNALVKFSRDDRERGADLEVMAYDAHWHATDQIPLRAVSAGLISPFGNIDPSDGGKTHRWSISGDLWDRLGAGELRATAYALDYHLDLFSDFTYFTDPRHGDQFEQYDNRHVYGGTVSYSRPFDLVGDEGSLRSGVQLRDDRIDPVGLYSTTDRIRRKTVSVTQARVASYALYASAELRLAPWWRTRLGARCDSYRFDVNANLPANSGTATPSLASPKLSMVFGPWHATEYFIDAGRGFHSNDARGATITVDPTDGVTRVGKVRALARAAGAEVGLRSTLPQIQLAASLWSLRLDSELRLDEDASAIVPSGATRRYGVELSASYHPLDSLLIDADLAWTHARYTDHDPAGQYIPNALERVASLGAEVNRPSGWFGGARVRYFGASPVNQDDSVRSRPSLQVYAEAGYHFSAQLSASLRVYNLLDRRDYDVEYYYASQLRGEPAPVNDIHFHPVEPRSLRASLKYRL